MSSNFAPEVQRRRLLVEGYFTIPVNEDTVRAFFSHLLKELQLRAYGEPIIFSPGGEGREENQGYDAFIPLIDSGISLYVWTGAKFFSAIIYTCKDFDAEKATAETCRFFEAEKFVAQEF